jgi:hypothetical protein
VLSLVNGQGRDGVYELPWCVYVLWTASSRPYRPTFADTSMAHEVSTSKQHESIFASDVLKALQPIDSKFVDLILPLQAELRGTLRDLYLHRCHISQTLPCPPPPVQYNSCFSLQ